MYLYNFFYAAVVSLSQFAGFHIGGYITLEALLLSPLYNGHQFYYNLGAWFVVPLFLNQLMYAGYRKIISQLEKNLPALPEWWHFAVFLSLGLLGNTLAIQGYRASWWLLVCRTLYFAPFYAFGAWYKRQLEEKDRAIPPFFHISSVTVLLVVLHQLFPRLQSCVVQ